VAIIFSSLQFFNIIRAPLTFFPLVLSAASDAVVALGRISKFLTAEEIAEPYAVDDGEDNKDAVRVDGSFKWETVGKPVDAKFANTRGRGRGRGGGGGGESRKEAKKRKEEQKKKDKESEESVSTEKAKRLGWFRRGKGKGKESVLPTNAKDVEKDKGAGKQDKGKKPEDKPFELNDVRMKVPKGAFVAIVGRVGSGKVRHWLGICARWLTCARLRRARCCRR
jgi:ATP-binding cassette, subfamily C (CFTR/MRP), member 1